MTTNYDYQGQQAADALQGGQRLHGFVFDECRRLDEIDADMYILHHEGTGLELIWLKRPEDNKTFAITFETLPWDDTGVFHILEHTVLNGSDKYPTKEPFVELLKNSLNTFLNAMTFPDKTMYPVASRNDKDFLNLVSVYLDAVFAPAIYHKPEIFRQEGWHYDWDEEGKLSYKGVVFNEMKGAFGDADEVMEMTLNRALFPDTPYGYVSGGEPGSIPDLTYENFLEAHRKFYAPSNGCVFLDGDVDLESVLALLQEEYLKDAQRTEKVAPPAFQKPVTTPRQEVAYEIGPGEDESAKTRMAWGRVLGSFEDKEKDLAMEILAGVLAGSNEAYLPALVVKEGLAEDVIMRVTGELLQPWIKLEARNFAPENEDRIRDLIFGEMKRLADEGIEEQRLLSAMDNLEFLLRERDYGSFPLGLVFAFQVMASRLYGGDPAQELIVGDVFDRLRAKVKEGYFENLLREVMLDNPHACEVVLTPSVEAGKQRRQREQDRLAAEEASWDEATRERLQEEQRQLVEWQLSEDSPEALATLPHLELADIDRMPEAIENEVKNVDGTRVLYYNTGINGIFHMTWYFDANDLTADQLAALSFVGELLGDLATDKHSAHELILEQQSILGRLNTAVEAMDRMPGTFAPGEEANVQFSVTFSGLTGNAKKAVPLVMEILTGSDWRDKAAIGDILKQHIQEMMLSFVTTGHTAAARRALAGRHLGAWVREQTHGYDYYQWLKALEGDFESCDLADLLGGAMKAVLKPQNLTVAVAAAEDFDYESEIGAIAEGIAAFAGTGEEAAAERTLFEKAIRRVSLAARAKAEEEPATEAILIPSDVGYSAVGSVLDDPETQYSGALRVAAHILSLEYLWNTIRVQGGAYGSGLSTQASGLIQSYSYRDPSPAASVEVAKKAGEFLADFAEEDLDLTGTIIGTISDLSPLLTPRQKATIAAGAYFTGLTYEDRVRVRHEILDTTCEDLKRAADILNEAMAKASVCLIGNEELVGDAVSEENKLAL